MIRIDKTRSTPLYLQIYNQIVDKIEDDVLTRGEKLPAITRQASELGVSRNTVEKAYDLLVRDGYVSSRKGSGFSVNERETGSVEKKAASSELAQQLADLREKTSRLDEEASAEFDFSYSAVDPTVIPMTSLDQAMLGARYLNDREESWKHGSMQGYRPLREHIVRYLAAECGVEAIPEQVIVRSGRRDAVRTALGLFPRSETLLYIQDPGCVEARTCIREMDYDFEVLHVDKDFKLVLPQEADDPRQKIVYVTPGNLFPLNNRLSLEEREGLLAWAAEHDMYLIEDEYCHEFHNDMQRLPSLSALDTHGRVITVGTFSKSLGSALCLDFVVLPPELMMRWLDEERASFIPVSLYSQAVLASYMDSGAWQRQLRRMQKSNREKHALLVDELEKAFGKKAQVLDFAAGAHLLACTSDGRSETELIEAARERGVRVYPTSRYWAREVPADWNYVMLGYSGMQLSMIPQAVRRLAEAWS